MTLAETIIENLCRRRGFDRAFDLDDDILEEIKQEMADAIDAHLREREAAKGETVAWQIETNDDVERVAKEAGWNNRSYMTPSDYAIWCNRMREFVRIAVDVPQPFKSAAPMLASARVPDAHALSLELQGVITDIEHGNGFDYVCLSTVKRVASALAAAPKRGEG